MASGKLTKGQRAFLQGVATSEGLFHKLVIEPCEAAGLCTYASNFPRLVGCNSFAASQFELTAAGRAALHD